MKRGINMGIIIGVIAAIVIIIGLAIVLILGPPKNISESGSKVDFSHIYSSSASGISGFEMKKAGENFVVYFHSFDETRANRVLAVLEQAGKNLYKQYLGIEINNTLVYIASSIDEYVKIADFPGGKENVQIGDGSAPRDKIYLYKPFENENDPKSGGVAVHEGTHAIIFQFLGQDKIQNLPGFLNEGMAYYNEFVFKAGADFNPLEQIYHSDLLINGIRTGNPKLMSLEELGQKCNSYITDETTNFLCRGQGTFIIWYLNKEYGKDSSAKFLADLKQTNDWKISLNKITGKKISELDEEISNRLKLIVK